MHISTAGHSKFLASDSCYRKFMTAKLRKMKPEDYPALRSLWISTPGMGLNNLDDSETGITIYLQRNPNTCFVIEDTGQVIAGILAGHDGRRGFIYHLVVARNRQGEGLGRTLTDASLSALNAEGIAKVALLTLNTNEEAQDYWKHLGFTLRTDVSYYNLALRELEEIHT